MCLECLAECFVARCREDWILLTSERTASCMSLVGKPSSSSTTPTINGHILNSNDQQTAYIPISYYLDNCLVEQLLLLEVIFIILYFFVHLRFSVLCD